MGDNGRTWSNPNPRNNFSVRQQIGMSRGGQVVNRNFVQPFKAQADAVTNSVAGSGIKIAAARITGNRPALNNAEQGMRNSLRNITDSINTAPATITMKNGKKDIAINENSLGYQLASGSAGSMKNLRPKPTVTGIDKAFRSTSGVMNKVDPRLSAMVDKRRDLAETGAAQAKAKLKITNTLNEKEQVNLARVIKGTEKPINDKVKAASVEARKVLNATYSRAKAAGVPVTGYKKNYFPQILNPKALKEGTNAFDKQVQHLISTKQAKNEAEAVGLLRKYRDSRKVGPYGNLTKSRSLDLTGYAENNAALHQYLERANATIAHTKVMGKDDAKLNKIFNDIRKNNPDAYDAVDKAYKQASRITRGSDTGEAVSRAITDFQGATKLGLSSIGNVTQKVNNAIVGGIGRQAKAMITKRTKANKDFVDQTGVTDEQVAHEALFGEQGIQDRKFKVPGTNKEVNLRSVTAPFFEKVEKGNRAEGAIVGRDQANSLAKKAAKGDQNAIIQLRRDFGIEKKNFSRGLTKQEQIRAARKFVERTQFRTQAQDLPGWASTPTGRVISQFRRYPYKQAQFLKREVFDPAKRGNLAPAVRLAAVGVPVGIGSQAAVGAIRGATGFNQSPGEIALDLVNDATGSSIVTSLAQGLYPNSQDANAYVSKVVKTLGGPSVGDATKAVSAGFDALKGNPKNAGRFALTHVPVVGTPASNRLLPYQEQKNNSGKGKNDFAKADDLAKQEKEKLDAQAKPDGFGITKLSNGKYWYQAGGKPKTSESLKEARDAVAKEQLKRNDSKDMQIVGKTVYYKDSDGEVKTQSKELFDWNQKDSANKLAMDRAYEVGDWNSWVNTAQQQYNALEEKKKMYNPKTQKDKIDDITLQQENLQQKADNYAEKLANGKGFGANKKGSTGTARGGGGGSKNVSSIYKYAVSNNAGVSAASKRPTVTGRRGGGGRPTIAKASKPKVTLKKSRV